MILKLNKQDKEKTLQLLEAKSINMSIAEMLLYAFDDVKAIVPCKTKEEFLTNLCNYWQIDKKNPENAELLEKCIYQNLKVIDEKSIADNPYFKNIKLPDIKIGGYALTHGYHLAYQPFAYDDIKVDNDSFLELQSVGYSLNDIKFPVISYKNTVWMSVNPNEINTMDKAVKEATGNVLVLGLGLGYFPHMISEKDDVKSVTIIEKDSTIIKLFTQYILPQFKHKDKIKIIEADAFEYLKKDINQFIYFYADMWHSPEDGLPMYLKLEQLTKNYKGKKFYWLERSILAMYRRCMLTLIEEQLNGFDKSNYVKVENDYDKIINDLYHKTENKVITSFSEIKEMLEDQFLKHL